jgi:SOS-response transcriptional repressor LexA
LPIRSNILPHSLTDLQRDYLDFIRDHIRKNESSPRLEEIAGHYSVRAPTAHKILAALQSKGYLYFGREPQSGFFIRLIERAGSVEVVMEVPIAGRVSALGEIFDFPQELGHFASVFVGAKPETVFALLVSENIPQANVVAGDLIIFDGDKKPQPGDICIGPIGKRLFLLHIASKTMDREMRTYETAIWYPIPNNLINPEYGQLLNWYPLAYTEETHDWFTKAAEEQNWPIAPMSPDFILATALRLTRTLAF